MAKAFTLMGVLMGLAMVGCQQHAPDQHAPVPPVMATPGTGAATTVGAPTPASVSSSTQAPRPEVGSDEWLAWVDRTAGVSDGHGHGPDFGSSEWCHAANWRVFHVRNSDGDSCSLEWMLKLDHALRQAGH